MFKITAVNSRITFKIKYNLPTSIVKELQKRMQNSAIKGHFLMSKKSRVFPKMIFYKDTKLGKQF